MKDKNEFNFANFLRAIVNKDVEWLERLKEWRSSEQNTDYTPEIRYTRVVFRKRRPHAP